MGTSGIKAPHKAVSAGCRLLLVGIYSQRDAIVFSILLGLSAAFIVVRPPKSDRRVPKRVRRDVIARDLKGVPFDPKLHHIDHIVPFSKGGDHSEENLRVMPKSDNLRRGARMPKFKDFR